MLVLLQPPWYLQTASFDFTDNPIRCSCSMRWLVEPNWKNIPEKILPPSTLCNEENPQLKTRKTWKDIAVDDFCKASGIN